MEENEIGDDGKAMLNTYLNQNSTKLKIDPKSRKEPNSSSARKRRKVNSKSFIKNKLKSRNSMNAETHNFTQNNILRNLEKIRKLSDDSRNNLFIQISRFTSKNEN